jgi:hypothetical protein
MRTLVNRQDSRGQEFGEGSGPVDSASSERPPVFRPIDEGPQVVKRGKVSWIVSERGELISRLREAEYYEGQVYKGMRLKHGGRIMDVLTSELPPKREHYEPMVGINRSRVTDRETNAWLREQGERVGTRGQGRGILMNYKRGEE